VERGAWARSVRVGLIDKGPMEVLAWCRNERRHCLRQTDKAVAGGAYRFLYSGIKLKPCQS